VASQRSPVAGDWGARGAGEPPGTTVSCPKLAGSNEVPWRNLTKVR
jgi:hypothetical protein